MVNAIETTPDETGMSPTGWDLRRRAPRVEDRVLMADTLDLLNHLPKGLRPSHLARQYPRVANEVSLLWPNTEKLKAYLNGLLADRRGNRQGFPALVHEEIVALRGYIEQRSEPVDTRFAA